MCGALKLEACKASSTQPGGISNTTHYTWFQIYGNNSTATFESRVDLIMSVRIYKMEIILRYNSHQVFLN